MAVHLGSGTFRRDQSNCAHTWWLL